MRTKKLLLLDNYFLKINRVILIILLSFLITSFAYADSNLLPNIGNYKSALERRSKTKSNEDEDQEKIIDQSNMSVEEKAKAKEVEKLKKERAKKLADKKKAEEKAKAKKLKEEARLKKQKEKEILDQKKAEEKAKAKKLKEEARLKKQKEKEISDKKKAEEKAKAKKLKEEARLKKQKEKEILDKEKAEEKAKDLKLNEKKKLKKNKPKKTEKKSKIKIKKGRFYVNNEPFIVKGIGYSNCRPKEQPTTKKINLAQERKDFKIIRDAGFNTLRTWKPFSLEELNLAAEFGLYVIQGTWIEYRENYTDPDNIKKTQETLARMAKESMEASNVLMFLVGNEPQPRQVFSVGLEKTNYFFREISKGLKKSAPKIPVSMSNWVQSDFLDDSMWDVASVNIYIYNPESVSHSMGYRGYTNWMKRTRARKKPFVITEFGLSVSKKGVGHKGYGGNSLEDQKEGILYMYKEALAGGVSGACVFEWIDEWWKNFNHPSDPIIHEDSDPEEWFGICYYDEEGKLHKRPVFDALQKFNQAICIEPKDSAHILKSSFPVKVYVEDSIKKVLVKVSEKGRWVELKRKSAHWFEGKVSIRGYEEGKNTLFIKAKGKTTHDLFESTKDIYINQKKSMVTPYKVEILLDKDTYYTENKMSTVRLRFQVKDAKGNLVPGQKITASIYEPVLNQKLILNLISNEIGQATHFYNINEEGILTVSAGVAAFSTQSLSKDQKMIVKHGDCKHIKIYYQKQ